MNHTVNSINCWSESIKARVTVKKNEPIMAIVPFYNSESSYATVTDSRNESDSTTVSFCMNESLTKDSSIDVE